MNGFQFSELTACAAPKMKSSTTASLMNTMALLTVADSLMPTTSSVVTIAMMTTAGRLKMAVGAGHQRAAGGRERARKVPAEGGARERHHVSGPADRHRYRAQRILEHQV